MFYEKLFGNHEIWIHIYHNLNFVDQLSLSRVNDQLKVIFELYIWKENYSTLIIKGNSNPSDFVISNETGINRLCLEAEGLQQFLSCYACGVQELIENRTGVMDLLKFPNLRAISYADMRISYKHLKLINECCPQLQKLHLSCLTEEECEFIEIGKNWSIKKVLKLKQLKSLRMEHEDYVKMKYRHFRKIVTKLKVESLELKASIEPDQRIIKADNKISQGIQLKELNIAASFEAKKWSLNFSWYLTNFENLRSLIVKITHTITEETLTIIAKTCRFLETLKIHYSTFEKLQEFPLPPEVVELSLHHCRGLTISVLQQLVSCSKTKLQRFSCHDPDFEGAVPDFHIAASIQALDIQGVDTSNIKLNSDDNKNLKELKWYHHNLFKDQRDILSPTNLALCKNLQSLEVKEGQIAVATLLQIESLQKLIIPHPRPLLNWHHITALLKHSSLEELSILDYCTTRSSKMFSSDIPIAGFPINISKLQLPLDLFDVALDFWLDLFEQNANMKLICCKFSPHDMPFLAKLINHKQFPKSLKTLDVCCFNIDCRTLRRDMNDTVEKLQRITVNYHGYEYNDDVFRIILCREKKRLNNV